MKDKQDEPIKKKIEQNTDINNPEIHVVLIPITLSGIICILAACFFFGMIFTKCLINHQIKATPFINLVYLLFIFIIWTKLSLASFRFRNSDHLLFIDLGQMPSFEVKGLILALTIAICYSLIFYHSVKLLLLMGVFCILMYTASQYIKYVLSDMKGK